MAFIQLMILHFASSSAHSLPSQQLLRCRLCAQVLKLRGRFGGEREAELSAWPRLGR